MPLLGGLLAAALVLGGLRVAGVWSPDPTCPPITDHPEWTVARRWNEVLLNAIRRDVPAPTVHARNLFHTSAAMWDAWAAFDPDATGVFVDAEHPTRDTAAARNEAISYAAFRVLEARYLAGDSQLFDAFQQALANVLARSDDADQTSD